MWCERKLITIYSQTDQLREGLKTYCNNDSSGHDLQLILQESEGNNMV
ncbi:hypothetical protein VQ7734_00218 [Vibrio quintilis]|uniref:Uncharacterized protein n=1 Tax=Vibrio quintilis TaxID=1117707 RepID=A0A1M7YPF9_9VIBR|nr:hypothetical protein VQ7734_00218 [Vibrio quintilis]